MTKPIKNQSDRDALNARELGYIADYLFEKTALSDETEQLTGQVAAFLHANKLALDVDDHTLQLKYLMYKTLDTRSEASFRATLDQWAAAYPAAVEKARQQSEKNRKQHADQPYGIYRGLTEKNVIDYKAWGEDLDILVTLRQILTTKPEDINTDGVYILSPASFEERDVIENKINEICKAHPDKKLQLLMPVNKGQNHWQLGVVDVADGQVVSQRIWDSIKARVQKNGYSCMDYVVQAALKAKFRQNAPGEDLQMIIAASDALSLREAIVNRILNVHEKMQNNQSLHESVEAQVSRRPEVESFLDISEEDEEGLHTALIANKDIQEEFDASMSTMLEELYKTDKASNEAVLFSVARKFAYQELLKKYGLFSESSSAALEQGQRPVKRV